VERPAKAGVTPVHPLTRSLDNLFHSIRCFVRPRSASPRVPPAPAGSLGDTRGALSGHEKGASMDSGLPVFPQLGVVLCSRSFPKLRFLPQLDVVLCSRSLPKLRFLPQLDVVLCSRSLPKLRFLPCGGSASSGYRGDCGGSASSGYRNSGYRGDCGGSASSGYRCSGYRNSGYRCSGYRCG